MTLSVRGDLPPSSRRSPGVVAGYRASELPRHPVCVLAYVSPPFPGYHSVLSLMLIYPDPRSLTLPPASYRTHSFFSCLPIPEPNMSTRFSLTLSRPSDTIDVRTGVPSVPRSAGVGTGWRVIPTPLIARTSPPRPAFPSAESVLKLSFHIPGLHAGAGSSMTSPVSPVVVTPLDPHETSTQEPVPRPAALVDYLPDADVSFRHSGWFPVRNRILAAIADVFPHSRRLCRFHRCGENAWVIRNEQDPEQVSVASDHCRDRFCQPCSAFRARVIAGNVSQFLGSRPYRFLTVTIKTTDLTLKQGVDKLYRSFAKLRRTTLWNQKVTGGCVVCEVKPKNAGDGWHPHLHCIIEGKYLPLKPLRKLWLQITGDSFILDISFGRDADSAASYVTKYVTKPFGDGVTRNHVRLCEAIEALHGRRLIATFGSWTGAALTKYVPSGVWVKVCTLCELRYNAWLRQPDAVALLAYLSANSPANDVPSPDSRGPPLTPADTLF